jgi:hypothetical protein
MNVENLLAHFFNGFSSFGIWRRIIDYRRCQRHRW